MKGKAFKNKKLAIAINIALIPLSGLLTSNTAVAQETEEAELERVMVTGSRITSDSATDAASPVSVIGGDTLRTAGQLDIGELLRESPALNNSLPANFSAINDAGTTDSDVGLGLLNLRGLGTNRTLTLVNGRRHVAGGQGSSAVDVNSIPSVMIQQVETLTGGASSVYGADAVSGVVNFILRKGGDFDGVELTAQAGMSSRSDAKELYLSGAGGFEFDNGRGEMVFAVEGQTNEHVIESDRSFAGPYVGNDIQNNPTIAALAGVNPDASRAYVRPAGNPISSPYGVFNLLSIDSYWDAVRAGVNGVIAGTGIPLIPGTNIPVAQVIDTPFTGIPRVYNPGVPANLNQSLYVGDGLGSTKQTILPEQERWSVNLNGSYELSESATLFVESKYAFSNNRQIQGVDFNDAIPIAYDNPYIPPALQEQITQLQDMGLIPPNPNDGSFYGFGSSRDADDSNVLPEDRVDRETFRIVFGVEGEIDVADGIQYELSYNYGKTNVDTNNINIRLEDRFYAALDSVVDPDTGDIVCRSSLDPTALPPIGAAFPVPVYTENSFSVNGRFTQFVSFTPGPNSGCAPFNPFGLNSTTQENADFVYVDTLDTSELEQKVIFASLAGSTSSFFELPGGPIGWATGAEYREEESTFTVSEVEGTLNTWDGSNGNAPTGLAGGFDVFEYFLELQAPILADIEGVELLEVTGAIRFADYSTVGDSTAWSMGLRYSPGFGLTLRSTVAESVRAPNISELFSPQQPDFFAFQDDPCSIQNINLGSPNRPSNCAEFVPDGYDVNDYITAGIPGVTGGNPMLDQEEATTVTAGFVYDSEIIDGLRVIIDYYNIEIEGAIDALSPERVAAACVDLDTTSNQFCPLITRAPEGYIIYHQSGQVNLGAFETSGVDFAMNYDFEIAGGSIALGLAGTHLLDFDEFQDPIDSTIFETRVGEFGFPEWITNVNASWSTADFTLSWSGRFEDSQLLPSITNQQIAGNPLFVDPSQTGSSWVHDLNFSYYVSDSLNLYGGLNNVFDRKPYLGSLSRPAGPRGRFGFIGFKYSI
ncbi:MAG TPA: TonB-dependent receptor [Alteromonas australica]|uniref:TonB-dependent receptor n=1 Tax=Alteromonas australica TaxID=589873 RepID=A0A358DV71_9ALTE|nr:TonB-dependent receptor [Alteromonas australica]HBU49843.1 TonB-dependent receptor [Alteromonas australica]HCY27258.1 TonB-dependent receptor [Alteromonas macleodii]|tara:strand:+ start:1212 stop:4346 length:3135 start_codon:yes stop_codon:yes gene_type:complete